ncbi:MAG: hypothetical protein Q4E89_00990 [Eubacteriales bacterium]|nr:hypothetical protein [Eubacteriales bacterium]
MKIFLFTLLTTHLFYKKIIYEKTADADCALVSINDYSPENGYRFNREGIGWHIWAGDINSDAVDIIRSNGTTLTVQKLTGAKIKDMLAEGYHVENGGSDYGQHSYLLVTRGGIELQDDQTYRLAMNTRDLPKEVRESLPMLEITPHDAIKDYIQELGTFAQEDVVWE